MTIDQQDGSSGLRNEYFSLVRGTINDEMTVNGKVMTALDPTLGPGTPSPSPTSASAFRSRASPTTRRRAPERGAVRLRGAGHEGLYRWQCFVPCAAGTLYGNGGPMQTLGYMAGELQVG